MFFFSWILHRLQGWSVLFYLNIIPHIFSKCILLKVHLNWAYLNSSFCTLHSSQVKKRCCTDVIINFLERDMLALIPLCHLLRHQRLLPGNMFTKLYIYKVNLRWLILIKSFYLLVPERLISAKSIISVYIQFCVKACLTRGRKTSSAESRWENLNFSITNSHAGIGIKLMVAWSILCFYLLGFSM